MIRLKTGPTGCRAVGMKPELCLGLLIAAGVYTNTNIDLMVTAITDSVHSPGSLHYVGYAADLGLPPADKIQIVVARLKEALGDEWDVLYEINHIHIEFQPKKALNT
jgi:hypothetical protein